MQGNELNFTADRLTLFLRWLSKPATWQAIETNLGRSILRVYELKMAALDPLGLPLATQVVAGKSADDPSYVPAVERVLQIIEGVQRPGGRFDELIEPACAISDPD